MTGDGRESAPRVLLVAFAVAFFCALLVSTAVWFLRPIQAAHQSLGQMRAVLVAAGLANPGEALEDDAIIARIGAIQTQLVDLDTGRVVEPDPALAGLYEYREVADSVDGTTAIPADQITDGLTRRPVIMPVYRVRTAASDTRIVVPVFGRGMWSTIHGLVGLGEDFSTITGVTFYEHGETAGIGDRIQNPDWLRTWRGKKIYAADGSVAFGIGARRGGADGMSGVDSITGATVTVTAVDATIRYWFGPHALGPFLAGLREAGG